MWQIKLCTYIEIHTYTRESENIDVLILDLEGLFGAEYVHWGLSIQYCLRNVFTSRRGYLLFSLLRSTQPEHSRVRSRTQQGWIRNDTLCRIGGGTGGERSASGGSRTLEISFIIGRTVNLHRIGTMMVHRRHDASLAAHPPWHRRRPSRSFSLLIEYSVITL